MTKKARRSSPQSNPRTPPRSHYYRTESRQRWYPPIIWFSGRSASRFSFISSMCYFWLLGAMGAMNSSKSRLTVGLLLAAMSISLLWPTGIIRTGLWPGSFLSHWHAFLLGVCAYWAYRHLVPVLTVFAIAVLGPAIFYENAFSIACAITAVILWAAAKTKWAPHALSGPIPMFLGSISYSLYLIHNPITGASFRVGYILTGRTLFWEAFWWTTSIVACIIAAAVMWWAVERPSLRLARRVSLNAGSKLDKN